jgi:hypothetical protein
MHILPVRIPFSGDLDKPEDVIHAIMDYRRRNIVRSLTVIMT